MDKYRPSINIIRDADVDLDYIPTPNSRIIFRQLVSAFRTGRKSFNIIGAYGTGKSVFLWAFEQNLRKKSSLFESEIPEFELIDDWNVVRIVGDLSSVAGAISEFLGMKWTSSSKPGDIIDSLESLYQEGRSKGKALLLLIDEFGKFLEYASSFDPDGEMYFLQMLAEFFNDPEKDAYLLTTLHQDFSSYSLALSKRQREEWDKVKGRYKELAFNEPVEQLLFLASKRQALRNGADREYMPGSLLAEIKRSGAFPLRDYLSEEIGLSLKPLDLLSAGILTIALQKFGQNKRSLFSFLNSTDHLGLLSFEQTQSHPFYNLADVFDYLEYNFHSLLSSKYNPEKPKWSSIRDALDLVERSKFKNTTEALKIVKVIGMCMAFAPGSAKIDRKFLSTYGELAMAITDPEKVIDELESRKVIRYSRHLGRYVPTEGTDVDIENAIDEAGNIIQKVAEVVPLLREYISFPYVLAKAHFVEKGTPRIFGYELSELPRTDLVANDQVDGFINLIFSEMQNEERLQEISKKAKTPILFGIYKNTTRIAQLLLEIKKIEKVIADNPSDRIAQRELSTILTSQIRLLNHFISGSQYGIQSNVVWVYNGEVRHLKNSKQFNQILSEIASDAYEAAPTFHNEMVNRTKLSTPINSARKRLIEHVFRHTNEENLGFAENRFPPERTIYLSLLASTGMHRFEGGQYILGRPTEQSFVRLWEKCESFLIESKQVRRSLNDLVIELKKEPFKLKQGLIEFWLPIFLYIKRDAYALFSDGKYIPFLTEEVLQLIHKDARKYEVKAYRTDGVHWDLFNRYRDFIQLSSGKKPTNQSLIETIKPFLVFYRQLPEYAQKTQLHISKMAISLRDAIARAKDPEVLFFEDFPRVLETTLDNLKSSERAMVEYIERLKDLIRELRTAYDNLLGRLESYLQNEIIGTGDDFPAYKDVLREKIGNLEYVRPDLKVLYQRVNSPLDDRDSWLASIGQAVAGKPLDRLADEDEARLFITAKAQFRELFALQELSHFAQEGEDVIRLEMARSGKASISKMVRILPRQREKLNKLAGEIELLLDGEDENLILALLTEYWERNLGEKDNE